MSTGSTSGVGSSQQSGSTASSVDAFSQLNADSFMKMLIAELQNQDPTEPVSNTEILQQVSQIDQVSTSQQLTGTMQSVQLGQNLATASNLIGQTVSGLSDAKTQISGVVSSVSIANGVPSLHIGTDTMQLSNVGGIDS
jgi:flagellar basal-body rod modification protein FlgD